MNKHYNLLSIKNFCLLISFIAIELISLPLQAMDKPTGKLASLPPELRQKFYEFLPREDFLKMKLLSHYYLRDFRARPLQVKPRYSPRTWQETKNPGGGGFRPSKGTVCPEEIPETLNNGSFSLIPGLTMAYCGLSTDQLSTCLNHNGFKDFREGWNNYCSWKIPAKFPFPNLTSLNLQGNKISDPQAICCQLYPSLRILNISCNFIENSGIINIVNTLTNLTEIDISNNRATLDGVAPLFNSNLALRKLNVAHIPLGDGASIVLLGGNLRQHLMELNLDDTKLGNNGANTLFKDLPSFTRLKNLSLRENGINEISDIPHANFSGLQALNLGHNFLCDSTVIFAERLCGLTDLNLSKSKIEGIHFTDNHWTTLRVLDLDANRIQLTNFVNLPKNWPYLKELHLCHNKLTDESIEHLAKSFFPALTTLSLGWNKQISTQGVTAISPISFPVLTYLDLEGTGIGIEGVKHLLALQNLPLTQLRWRYDQTTLELSGQDLRGSLREELTEPQRKRLNIVDLNVSLGYQLERLYTLKRRMRHWTRPPCRCGMFSEIGVDQ